MTSRDAAVEQRMKLGLKKALAPARHVEQVRYVRDADADGPAIVFYVILSDRAPDSAWDHVRLSALADEVRGVVFDVGLDAWPYVRFRSAWEQHEFDVDGLDRDLRLAWKRGTTRKPRRTATR